MSRRQPKDTNGVKRLTTAEIADRRQQVMRLRLQGLTPAVIAKLINVSPATVSTDLKAVQQEQIEKVDALKVNEFMADALEMLAMVEEKAWSEYQKADPGSPARLKALDMVRRVQLDKLTALSDVGIFKKPEEVPKKIEHEHHVRFDLPPQARQNAARALLNETLASNLLEPSPDGEPEPDNVLDVDAVEVVDETGNETGMEDE